MALDSHAVSRHAVSRHADCLQIVTGIMINETMKVILLEAKFPSVTYSFMFGLVNCLSYDLVSDDDRGL